MQSFQIGSQLYDPSAAALIDAARIRFEVIRPKLSQTACDAIVTCLGIGEEKPDNYLSELRKDHEITSFEEIECRKFLRWLLLEIEVLATARLLIIQTEWLHEQLQALCEWAG